MFTAPPRDRSRPLSPARTVSADPHTPLPKRPRHHPHPASTSVFLPSSPSSSSSSDHASPSPSPPPPPEPNSPQPPNSASTHRNLAQLRRDRLRHKQARRPVTHHPLQPPNRTTPPMPHTRSNRTPHNNSLQPLSTRVVKKSNQKTHHTPMWSHISAAAVRELARPVLAVRTEQRDIELAWFGRKVYGGAKGGCGVGAGVDVESAIRKGVGASVARLPRRPDPEVHKVETREPRHRKLPAASAKRTEHGLASANVRRVQVANKVSTDGGREEAPVRPREGRFFVKATCRYGWENSTRCVFVENGCSFRVLKEQLAEAFNMEKKFDVSYKDEDGDVVRISTEAEMPPFLNLVRKQGDKVRVRMVAPDGPGVGKDLRMAG